ncbi:MAG: hypothetical protein WBO24_20460, partial [Nitrospirales bacterium]
RSACLVRNFLFRSSGVSSPDDEPLLFRQKWPKPLTPRLALLEGRDANPLKRGPTRGAQTRAARCEERPSLGPAGRRLVNGLPDELRVSLVGWSEGGGENVKMDAR